MGHFTEDDGGNPFKLPPDDEIFRLREQEWLRRAEEREKVKKQHVWEKTTSSSICARAPRRMADGPDEAAMAAEAARQAKTSTSEGIGHERREKKENVADFVAKKREMFLVQMSLDVKKAEILKLDEKAKQKEEALKKSQQMLDEDVTRFDAFLQNNDAKAHKAMKQAEDMTKKKQERMQTIKALKSQLSAIQSEIAKHREQKDECLKFKGFLTKLTPQEWKEMTKDQKMERKRLRRQEYVDRRMAEINKSMQSEMDAEEREMQQKAEEGAGKRRRRGAREQEEEAKEREKELALRKRKIRARYPTAEAVEGEYKEVSSGEEMPLYFQEPKQLLDVFTSLEESNLFLIQNSQDTEQSLEELQQQFSQMKRTSDAKTERMQANIDLLEKQIADEKQKSTELMGKVSRKDTGSEQHELLLELASKVMEVHNACGYEAEHDPDTLVMLGSIEAKLEEFLTVFDEAEDAGYKDLVATLERQAETHRRSLVKRQRKEQQEQKNEQRLKASLLRSQAPIHKKVGKQIMFRSAPLFQARRVVEEDDGFEDAMKEHEVFGIWMSKEGIPIPTQPTKAN
jgi:hypothetical protein|mmetsp:Transcript_4791/g.14041  ORF Transcript_4791/g.14041 Transcript_4791/m.14041 type:complete len:570 (+) Transcript_4791:93-1802(+)